MTQSRIALVWATRAGRLAAERLAAALPGAEVCDGPVREQLTRAWSGADQIVAFLATGAAVRLVAPLLADKANDPAVVCVDEAGRYAVALLGGHAGGGNALAVRVGELLGAEPVVTTATDASAVSPLDRYGSALGFRLADRTPVAAVTRAMLDGEPVWLEADQTWPLPALPPNVSTGPGPPTPAPDTAGRPVPGHRIVISDRRDVPPDAVVYRPPSLVVGVGASRGVPADELAGLVDAALRDAGLAPESVRGLATVDLKADETGILDLAAVRGWPLFTHSAEALAAVGVPHPSEVVRAAVGTPSVAEAAALLTARQTGRGAELVVPKRASAMGTVAVARLVPKGRLTLVGLGPGAEDLLTPRAATTLRAASIVVGLDSYVDQIRHLLRPGTRIEESGLGSEEKRARTAVALATEGHAVALIGSGDAGVYAMASPALEFAGADVDVAAVPGVTAALAASALLGAPLGHDHAYLSLSDLHTPWPVIEQRVRAVAAADLVACLYNPRSAKRDWQLGTMLGIFAAHRPGDTPVGLVRDATRPGQRVTLTTLRQLASDPSGVDMLTVVLVGASTTREIAGRMVTPRGYRWMPGDPS
ncbi:MAG: precorrin-3B C(17)-methyltransferase [Micromonosporaceae bacterium]